MRTVMCEGFTHLLFTRTPDMAELTINANTRIQILDKLPHLARARKHQYAAFIRDEAVLCVWADAVESIVNATEALEESLIDYIWHQENAFRKEGFAARLEAHAQQERLLADCAAGKAEATGTDDVSGEALSVADPEDLARSHAQQRWKQRPVMLYDAFSTGMTAIITISLLALGWRESSELWASTAVAYVLFHLSGTLIKGYLLDGDATRFILVVTGPVIACVAMVCVRRDCHSTKR